MKLNEALNPATLSPTLNGSSFPLYLGRFEWVTTTLFDLNSDTVRRSYRGGEVVFRIDCPLTSNSAT